MAELGFQLHTKQQEIWFSPARFKVVAAGRRGGKTFLAAAMLIIAALAEYARNGRKLTPQNVVWYVGPTYEQAKEDIWLLLKELARPVTAQVKEKDLTIILVNGRHISLKGADREDRLRGASLHFLVIDEYADMKPDVFDIVLSPALADCEGAALIIGTPKGKNHFYQMWSQAADPAFADEWEAFHFCSLDNPMINPKEVESARQRLSRAAFRQEFEANFSAAGGGAFKESDIVIVDKIPGAGKGSTYMAVDPNGYKDTKALVRSKLAQLDETSIAVVEVHPDGWYVKDMIHGRWGIRETSLKIIRAAQQYRPALLGVENMDAIRPYLEDQMRRLNVYPTLQPLKHGGQKKTDRIIWALQGRFENKRIKLLKGPWNAAFIEQLLDFPNPLAHDDMPDSLAYTDQLAVTVYHDDVVRDEWTPTDSISGY